MKEAVKFPADQMLISMSELKEQGFTHYKIRQLVDAGVLNKLNKKYYENTAYTGDESDFLYAYAYAPEGVICLMSAAVYYDLTTYRPDAVDVAIERKTKVSTLPDFPELNINYYTNDRDLNRLIRYAEMLKCGDALKTYLEVLV